jgi:hypothetical protein
MQRLFVLATIGTITLQVLDGTFISVKQSTLFSKSTKLDAISFLNDRLQTCEISRRCRRRCISLQKHVLPQIAGLDSVSSNTCRCIVPDAGIARSRRAPRATCMQQSPTPIESSTLQFDKFAKASKRELYSRDVIFCGDERIPFLRASFGNNDNVDAKVTFGRLERTPLISTVNCLIRQSANLNSSPYVLRI